LRRDTPGSLRALALIFNEVQYRSWGEMLHTVRTGEPAFEREVGMPVFEYYAQHPDVGEIFNEAMISYTTGVANAVVAAYDFSAFRIIVDVGGGYGTLLTRILQANKDARGVLFDLPHVIARAETYVAGSGVADRCTLVAGDFFTGVPGGGDAYVLAGVLHDWSDEKAVEILGHCRQATGGRGTLHVIDLVIPPGDEPSFGKWLDLHMLAMSGGRERTEPELATLLRNAGFQLNKVVPTAAGPSIVVARPI
jgi:hypothetical protein